MSPLTKKGTNRGFGGALYHSLRGNGFHRGSLDIEIEGCLGSYSNG